MAVELRPLGVKCNLACQYCYQNPQRDAGNHARGYDLDAMRRATPDGGEPFVLFGGEPLLVPIEDLEALWRWGLERHGGNVVQTNGTLITDAHMALFERYRVHVGISVDGPGDLNDARWNGTLERTRDATERTLRALDRLLHEGHDTSLIVTLHRGNASANALPRLCEWLRGLDAAGLSATRLHLLEIDHPGVGTRYRLSARENVVALERLMALESELVNVRFDLFDEMAALLSARDGHGTCVWRACDPYTTEAVQGVEGDGQRSNCGRTNKLGVDFTKADQPGYERYVALYHTPQAHGGCRGCRFFLACKGQCPGTAIDGDFRNRTEQCETWKAMFERIEARLSAAGDHPISAQPNLVYLEAEMLAAWAEGRNPTLEDTLAAMHERTAPTA